LPEQKALLIGQILNGLDRLIGVPGKVMESVVLVPGVGFGGIELQILATRLRVAGFQAHTFWRSPDRSSLAAGAEALHRWLTEQSLEAPHFVAHSLGGLETLEMLRRFPLQKCARIVLLGSPLGGCLAARRVARLPSGRWGLGQTVCSIFSGANLPLPSGTEVGALAGRLNCLLGLFLCPGHANDTLICVDETRHPGLADHTTVLCSHAGMLVSTLAATRVVNFLRFGRFVTA
jgi:pimeloyl-ACP methyl ester carboxylesterase